MPKPTKKQTGYLVKIEAFVPAELSDMTQLAQIQEARMKAIDLLAKVGGEINALIPTIVSTRR